MRKRFNLRSKSLHPDRTSRLPLHVRYVADKALAGLRYFMELYINLNHGGAAPSIDAPISVEYPSYNSVDFAARCAVQPEDLTQDPFIPPPPQDPPPQNNFDEGGELLGDPNGKDLPVESSAFDRVDFETSDLVDGLEAIDNFNLADTLKSF